MFELRYCVASLFKELISLFSLSVALLRLPLQSKYKVSEFEVLTGARLSKSLRFDAIVAYGDINVKYSAAEAKVVATGRSGIPKYIEKAGIKLHEEDDADAAEAATDE